MAAPGRADGEGALRDIVRALRKRFEQSVPPLPCETIETHISFVLLAGERAIKLKKPVDLGFVDFSTLALRQRMCERELELNRAWAPDLYLHVAAIVVGPEGPELVEPGEDGAEPVEYAVVMRRFDDARRLDRIVEAGGAETIDFAGFGRSLAGMHARAEPCAVGRFGTARLVRAQIQGAFEHIGPVARVVSLSERVDAACGALAARMESRRRHGHVRRCHGDLHLSNIADVGGEPTPFDCIEFNDELGIIDTASDVAFLLMDLDFRGESASANVVLNEYLAAGGDYDALAMLDLYCAYRSLVRAKVAELQRAGAKGGDDAGKTNDLAARRDAHLALAERYLDRSGVPGLAVTYGLSGSGKTHFARALAKRAGFIHLRSDVERRRFGGADALGSTGSPVGGGLYTADMGERTYARLNELADGALGAGFSVVVDATFLTRADRESFRSIARRRGLPFRLLSFDAPHAVLRERVVARAARGDDASEAGIEVLERQIASAEPLGPDEQHECLQVQGLGAAELDDALLGSLGRPRIASSRGTA